MPGDLDAVSGLVREAAEWLRTSKDTDQWARPWPDRIRHRERMVNDLLKGKTWLVWDGETAVATITVDTDEPVDLNDKPVWPERERHRSALYVRRVVVARTYSGCGLGAALLDWAADVAKRDHGAELIRIDVWTTNLELHAYYEGQRFIRQSGKDPGESGRLTRRRRSSNGKRTFEDQTIKNCLWRKSETTWDSSADGHPPSTTITR